MAKLVFGLQQSVDGYVDHRKLGPPGPSLFHHFMEHVRNLKGVVYGRRTYEIMRYWDEDQADWGTMETDFAAAWRRIPKWVVSRTLTSVGPNATLIANDIEGAIRKLKDEHAGDIDVAGPELAQGLADFGLIDEYRLYLRPMVLGSGTPFFAGPRPALRLIACESMGDDVVRLAYAPA